MASGEAEEDALLASVQAFIETTRVCPCVEPQRIESQNTGALTT